MNLSRENESYGIIFREKGTLNHTKGKFLNTKKELIRFF